MILFSFTLLYVVIGLLFFIRGWLFVLTSPSFRWRCVSAWLDLDLVGGKLGMPEGRNSGSRRSMHSFVLTYFSRWNGEPLIALGPHYQKRGEPKFLRPLYPTMWSEETDFVTKLCWSTVLSADKSIMEAVFLCANIKVKTVSSFMQVI